MIQHIWEIKISWTTFCLAHRNILVIHPDAFKLETSFFLPKAISGPTGTSSASIFLLKLLGGVLICSYTFIFLILIFFFPTSIAERKAEDPNQVVWWYQQLSELDQRFAQMDSHSLNRDWRKQGGFSGWEGPRTHMVTRILDRGHTPAAHSMLTTAGPFGGNSFWWTWLIPARSEPITLRWTTLQPLNIFSDFLGWYFSSQTPIPLLAINRSPLLRFCLFCTMYLVWNTIYILSQQAATPLS